MPRCDARMVGRGNENESLALESRERSAGGKEEGQGREFPMPCLRERDHWATRTWFKKKEALVT